MRRTGTRGKNPTTVPNYKFFKGNNLYDFTHMEVEVKLKPRPLKPLSDVKVVQNVSLQAWDIPTAHGSIKLAPGASVNIPSSVITERLINLKKRRLVTIR